VQLKRLIVGKGKTSRPCDADEWSKEYYELEASIENSSELEATRANLSGLIDGWLSPHKPATRETPKKTQLSSQEIEKLPWKTYNSKEDCKPNEAGWIFTNTPGAEALSDLIKKQGKEVVVQIGDYNFSVKFSGAENQFIGRAPAKTQT
jgi:DNA transposition AAA+ family ATPase